MEIYGTELGLAPLQAEISFILDPTPWRTHKPNIDFQLKRHGKKTHNIWKLLTEAQSILNTTYSNHIHIFTDGSVSKETDRTAAAMRSHLHRDGTIQKSTKLTSINNNHLQTHLMWSPSHIQLQGNELADREAKQGLQEYIITGERHLFWENSTKGRVLHTIQPTVSRKNPIQLNISPAEQRIINRVRTGKTNLRTCQGPNQRAFCQTCKEDLTLQHIINDCQTNAQERHKIHRITEQDRRAFYIPRHPQL
ncbi:hypothetical protein CHS0354_026998 [Potamilus streckersoni]|uniref:RNase H type-1 domain-containing protein n=1 Tax=Potamilus streckersoni TaxID=2493646 RepID=A0AAE0SCG9_9BIVA|nr:hypothetical protein CHS0354_026998 [Potamilus streckersoni]